MEVNLNSKGLLLITMLSTGVVLADYTSEIKEDGVLFSSSEEVQPAFEMVEGSNGRCRKWNEGMLECWGSSDNIAIEGTTITYPHPFKSGASIKSGSGSSSDNIHVVVSSNFRSSYGVSTGKDGSISTNNNTSFTMQRDSAASNQGTYYATGYWK